jgi:hypothetical protein
MMASGKSKKADSHNGQDKKTDKKSQNNEVSKRDIIKEIEDLKSRQGDYYPYPLLSNWQIAANRVSQLQQSFDWVKSQGNSGEGVELLKYIPVGLVATIESFFTGVISQLIDFSPIYLERVSRLKKTIQFNNIDYMIAIHKKRVSVGEFVSHQLKINNLNNVLNHINAFIESEPPPDPDNNSNYDPKKQKFWKSLKEVTHRESGELILKNPDTALQNIGEMFTIRHCIAHEMDFYIHSKLSEIEEGLKNTLDFINATGEFVAKIMDIPVTLREKLQYSKTKLERLEAELGSLTQKFREVTQIRSDEDGFDSENKSWESFINTHTGFAAWRRAGTGGISVDGENGNELAHRDIRASLIESRIKVLKNWIGTERG